VSLEFNRLIEYYHNAEEIIEPTNRSSNRNNEERKGEKRSFDRSGDNRNGDNRRAEKGYTRLFINLGKMDGANPANLMGFINDHVSGKVRVGKIDLLKNFSFFEVPEGDAKKVVNTFKGLYVEDRKLVVEVAQDSSDNKSNSGGYNFKRKER